MSIAAVFTTFLSLQVLAAELSMAMISFETRPWSAGSGGSSRGAAVGSRLQAASKRAMGSSRSRLFPLDTVLDPATPRNFAGR
jgi:hypothetical protein